MESERNTRIIALAALILGVASLSIGFAVYTRDLFIKPSAEVNLDSAVFKVVFSKKSNTLDISNITANENSDGSSGENAVIDNDGSSPTISNLKAKFTKPGQKVTYEFYVLNIGEVDAYLSNITFNKIASKEVKKECKAALGDNPAQDPEKIKNACDGITLTLSVAEQETVTDSKKIDKEYKLNKKNLETYSSHKVKIEIEYKQDAALPDGNITVEFGNIDLNYSSTSPVGA